MTERKIIVIQRLFLAGLIFSFLLPLETSLLGLPIYPFDILLLPLGIAWFGDLVYHRRTYPVSSTEILLYLLVSWIFLTGITAFDTKLSFVGGLIWLRAVILFSIVRTTYGRVYSKHDIYSMAAFLVLIQSALIIVQGVFQIDVGALNQYFGERTPLSNYQTIGGYNIYRAQGTLGNPNTVANWLILLVPIVGVATSEVDGMFSERIHYWAAVLGTTAVLFTISEGLIAILFGYVVLASALYIRPSRYTLFGLGSLSGLLLVSAVAFTPLLKIISASKSLSKRIELIELAIEIFAKRPLYGTGYNNFITGIELFVGNPGIFIRGSTTSVHNIPILFAVETGIIGAILFITFLLVVSRDFIRANTRLEDHVTIEGGYLISFLGLLGSMMIYTTFTSFQFLPLATVVISSGIAICENQ